MKIRIDLEKLKKMALSRVSILLFFLIGIFFAGIIPMGRISELRDKIAALERRRQEQLGKLEAGERKIEKIQEEIGILERERLERLKEEKEKRRDRIEFQNLSEMKGVVALLMEKNRVEIESIGRAALREVKDSEGDSGKSYPGKRYEAVVPYSVRGSEIGIKKLFSDFHGRVEELGLKSTSLEVRYLNLPENGIEMEEKKIFKSETGSDAKDDNGAESRNRIKDNMDENSFKRESIDRKREGENREIEVKFRAVGIVGDSRESEELEGIENFIDKKNNGLKRVVERGYITVSGRDYEIAILEDGRKMVRRRRGKP